MLARKSRIENDYNIWTSDWKTVKQHFPLNFLSLKQGKIQRAFGVTVKATLGTS